mmetsp:Transcript_35853/g.103026  ORF Transcript_35853/g.103026 Transcript_35853/m.103026 type:complete len:335 (+) Transcript_35853:561-1565(+)
MQRPNGVFRDHVADDYGARVPEQRKEPVALRAWRVCGIGPHGETVELLVHLRSLWSHPRGHTSTHVQAPDLRADLVAEPNQHHLVAVRCETSLRDRELLEEVRGDLWILLSVDRKEPQAFVVARSQQQLRGGVELKGFDDGRALLGPRRDFYLLSPGDVAEVWLQRTDTGGLAAYHQLCARGDLILLVGVGVFGTAHALRPLFRPAMVAVDLHEVGPEPALVLLPVDLFLAVLSLQGLQPTEVNLELGVVGVRPSCLAGRTGALPQRILRWRSCLRNLATVLFPPLLLTVNQRPRRQAHLAIGLVSKLATSRGARERLAEDDGLQLRGAQGFGA